MSKVTNQIEKVNSKTELQKITKELNEITKELLDPHEAITVYEAIKKTQLNLNYNDFTGNKTELANLIFSMEKLRECFFKLHVYSQILYSNSIHDSEILIEFKPNGK